MSDDSDTPKEMVIRDSSGQSWTVPIPVNVQREIAACTAIDRLRASLATANTALTAGREARGLLSGQDFSPRLLVEFELAICQVEAAFGAVEANALMLIAAVNKMLGI